jgi:hypothetical protein
MEIAATISSARAAAHFWTALRQQVTRQTSLGLWIWFKSGKVASGNQNLCETWEGAEIPGLRNQSR